MSLEQQIGALVKASENLTGAVNGKIGEIDKEVDTAKAQFQQFQNDADERYKTHLSTRFKVGGEWGRFYPIRIDLRGGPVNMLNIYRPDLYENKGNINGLDSSSNPGTFTASIMSIGDNWAHRTPFYAFDTYHEKGNRFIGKVTNHYRVQSLWVWLRGGGIGYWLTHDSLALDSSKVRVYDVETPDLVGSIGVYLGGYNSPDRGINYPAILESEIDSSLPNNGYIRGVI